MKRPLASILASLIVSSLLPAACFAGIMIEVATRGPGDSKKETISTMRAELDRLSVRNEGMWGIFRSDKQVMWLVTPKEGKYTEVSAADMKQLDEQLSGAMADVQKQLASLPPEQRAMAEKAMGSKLPGQSEEAATESPAPLSYKATGKTQKINKHLCKSYDLMQGDKKVCEAWLADWKEFGLRLEDFKVFGDFAAFTSSLTGPLAKQLGTGFEQTFTKEYVPGLPIRTITQTASGPFVTEIKKIEKQEIAASEFEPPTGLKKESLADMSSPKEEK